ncbi:hypothetical protein MalM14_07610 [Gimesia chilikensis]|nr:hypothetical protein MalM14_07610 [Gimesia chilikensis]
MKGFSPLDKLGLYFILFLALCYPLFLIYTLVTRTRSLIGKVQETRQDRDTSPVVYQHRLFKIQHPANWKVSEDEVKENIQFSRGGNSIKLNVFEGNLVPEAAFDSFVEINREVFNEPRESPLYSYGPYQGMGVVLQGIHKNFQSQSKERTATLKLFACTQEGICLGVRVGYLNDELEEIQPALTLMEDSLKLTPLQTPNAPS